MVIVTPMSGSDKSTNYFTLPKKAGSIGWSLFRMVVVAGTLYWGRHAAQMLEIMVLGIIVGACLILSVLHAYNMLFMPGQGYESVGENRRPRSFGNGYWR